MPHGNRTRQDDVSPHRTGAEESIKAKVSRKLTGNITHSGFMDKDYDLCCRLPPGGDQVVTAFYIQSIPVDGQWYITDYTIMMSFYVPAAHSWIIVALSYSRAGRRVNLHITQSSCSFAFIFRTTNSKPFLRINAFWKYLHIFDHSCAFVFTRV